MSASQTLKQTTVGSERVSIESEADNSIIVVDRDPAFFMASINSLTHTLTDPTKLGQRIVLSNGTGVTSTVYTFASAINIAGNDTLTLTGAGSTAELIAIDVSGTLRWKLQNGGVGTVTPS